MNGVPVATRRTARSGAKSAMLRASGVPTSSRNRVRVTIIAENMLMSTPRPRVSANPFTRVAPNWSPNHQRIPHVISVETLLSRIEDQATGKILIDALHVEIPGERMAQARNAAKVLGNDIFDNAIADFAAAYADQTERDHDSLMKAVRGGRLGEQARAVYWCPTCQAPAGTGG